MELYESNYMLIRLLIPSLRQMQGGAYVSQPDGLLPLEIRDVEHSRYTTTFKLTYRFTATANRQTREPDLSVRLYHDARACEVMSGLLPAQKHVSRRTRDLGDGYRLNRFLQRWVGYCLRQGHRFDEPLNKLHVQSPENLNDFPESSLVS